jgi:dTDP-4-dehydrorhamnose 3,5-epimerase-like enzyme
VLTKEILFNENRAAVRKQIEAYAKSPEAMNQPYGVAAGYATFGDKEAAFLWLNKAYDIRQADLVMVHIEPAFDFLRDDPRYLELVKKAGL